MICPSFYLTFSIQKNLCGVLTGFFWPKPCIAITGSISELFFMLDKPFYVCYEYPNLTDERILTMTDSEDRYSLPPQYEVTFGLPKVRRNIIDQDTMMVAWDAIQPCVPRDCPMEHLCMYVKVGKCKVLSSYLKGVTSIIFRNYKEKLTEDQFLKIGLHIIPLYKNLCRMKMYELGLDNVVYTDDKGNYKANPIFREIREEIKLISSEWKSLGLDSFDRSGREPKIPTKDKMIHGDPSYHEKLEKRAKRLISRRSTTSHATN